ncbi:hypothetical protein [Nocardiopsis trehalosi]|jgi:hypothetical protein|uniref:hypothetical protein n=1 Tax=Nocardiopsis trehalosi TaxID=109329 RepID=UPI0008354ED7|nr:hypothetical protein [Nocardiopsis trehalosi]
MSEERRPPERPSIADRVGPAVAEAVRSSGPDATDRRGSLGVADQVQQTPGVMGEAIMEALMAFLRANARHNRRGGRLAGKGIGMAVLVAGALLARAYRNRKARNGQDNNQVTHVSNPQVANPVNVEIARVARNGSGDRELTGTIRKAIENNPGIPADVKAHVAGPSGDAAIDRVLESVTPRQVDSALRFTKRQEELIERVSVAWNTDLGFNGSFEDGWRHARANPALAGPGDPVAAADVPEGWQGFAGWDSRTPPSPEDLDRLHGAWLSAIASVEPEAADTRRRIEALVAKWDPQRYAGYSEWLVREGMRTGNYDIHSPGLDRISAAENAGVHAGADAPVAADGRPLKLPEQWERLTADPDELRRMDAPRLRDLVGAWTLHTGAENGTPTPLADPAAAALENFTRRLAEANPQAGAEYVRLTEAGRTPAQAYTEVSRRASGHPFAPDTRITPAEERPEAPRRAPAPRRAADTAEALVGLVQLGRELTPAAVQGADDPLNSAFSPAEQTDKLSRYPRSAAADKRHTKTPDRRASR